MNVITGFQLGDVVAPLENPGVRMTVIAIHPNREEIHQTKYHCFWFDEHLQPNELIVSSSDLIVITPHNGIENKVSIRVKVKLMHCHNQCCPAMDVIGLLEKTHAICQWEDTSYKNHISVFPIMALRPIRTTQTEEASD